MIAVEKYDVEPIPTITTMKKPVVCATYYYFNDTKDRETLL
jgi:hypothetical protein